MQGMASHESVALILGAITTYGLLVWLGREFWIELGLMRGWAVIGFLCLTTVAWLFIIDIVRGSLGSVKSEMS